MDTFGHGDVTVLCGVVPVDGESTEDGTSPFNGDGVEFLEDLDEVVGVLFSDVLDAKVVNNEGGGNDGLDGVLP